MPHGVKVFGRVFVFRRVAAANVTTDHTKPQMHPDIAHLQAFFATPGMGLDVLDLAGM